MNNGIQILQVKGDEAASVVDPFYEKEGKNHRARNSDLFFIAMLNKNIVGVCRFCVEENTPLLRSMIIHAPLRSQKIGSKILENFSSFLDHNKIGPTYCIPYSHLEGFYGTIGFKKISENDSPDFLKERISEYRQKFPDSFMIMRRD